MSEDNVFQITVALVLIALIAGCTTTVVNRDNKRSEDRIELWRCQDDLIKEKFKLD